MADIGEDVKEINKYLLGVIRAHDELALIERDEAELRAKLSSSGGQNDGDEGAAAAETSASRQSNRSDSYPQPPEIPAARFEEFMSRFRE